MCFGLCKTQPRRAEYWLGKKAHAPEDGGVPFAPQGCYHVQRNLLECHASW